MAKSMALRAAQGLAPQKQDSKKDSSYKKPKPKKQPKKKK
jgi:hypothetical protein